MGLDILPAWMSVHLEHAGAKGSQKRTSFPLELELYMAASCHICTGN